MQRAGAVQRHFDDAERRVEQQGADLGSALRLEPAQDRDQRRAEVLEAEHGGCPQGWAASRELRAAKAASCTLRASSVVMWQPAASATHA